MSDLQDYGSRPESKVRQLRVTQRGARSRLAAMLWAITIESTPRDSMVARLLTPAGA